MSSKLSQLGQLGSGELVLALLRSPKLQPLLPHLPTVLSLIYAEDRKFFVAGANLGMVVGQTVCVQTSDQDKVVEARRHWKPGLTRFVLYRQPEDTTWISCILQAMANGPLQNPAAPHPYELVSAFFGEHPEPEPWAEKHFRHCPQPEVARARSQKFWGNHALVWGSKGVHCPECQNPMSPEMTKGSWVDDCILCELCR